MKNLFATLLFLGVCLAGYSQDYNATITALGQNPFSSESIRINVEFDNEIAAYFPGVQEVGNDLLALINGYTGNGLIYEVTAPDSRTIAFDVHPRIDGPVTIVIPPATVFDSEGNTNILSYLQLEFQGDQSEPFTYTAGLPGTLLFLEDIFAQ